MFFHMCTRHLIVYFSQAQGLYTYGAPYKPPIKKQGGDIPHPVVSRETFSEIDFDNILVFLDIAIRVKVLYPCTGTSHIIKSENVCSSIP